jgi:YVTN family beta-propeller protein
VTVIDGATNDVMTNVAVDLFAGALCYNARNNKVYCTNLSGGNSTVWVIDGATDKVLATIATDNMLENMLYDPQDNKVYCAAPSGYIGLLGIVVVIDGATDRVVATIGVGYYPDHLVCNPVQNRVYVTNYEGSSISVIRDIGGGIEELPSQAAGSRRPTIIRGVLELGPSAVGRGAPRGAEGTPSAVLLDASGRRVLSLKPGANDVSRLAPGVYFVREQLQASSPKPQATRKIIVQH